MVSKGKNEGTGKMEYVAPEAEIYDHPVYKIPEALVFMVNQMIQSQSKKAAVQVNRA